ncbi:hypothetical protein PhCBS80983_g03869 [Powellomyces hirtus]|uniref:Lariat debranching enzyme C-terminal domain-containing protein n=1 Tax=Powellomyces hirtus TaxID=109895 RepID=A0A507E2Q0_9FUNG|nr:hypothetical protein PhCBS80983_g03869 [Powellomyces hirtus]
MKIAIEGCCHGELDRIYASLANLQRVEKITVDLLLVCGDFQSIRNTADLGSLACPDKYRALGTFYQYYTGEKKAPIPTIFVGGNHEASSYLWELYHGGWVAPNIYYLGFAGVVKFGGLRICGLSGIYKKHDYDSGYFERQPFNDSHSRSVYHVRKFNVYRLAQIARPLDIMVSHDWPRGIAMHGNTRALVHTKPFLAGEINTNTLGSYPNEFLMKRLRPSYWFAAHLHVKFAAVFRHEAAQPLLGAGKPVAAEVENPDEINIGSDSEDEAAAGAAKTLAESDKTPEAGGELDSVKAAEAQMETDLAQADPGKAANGGSHNGLPIDAKKSNEQITKFLALDKCLPGRDFLQVIDFPEADDSALHLSYDEEWLAIMRATHDLFSLSNDQKKVPEDSEISRRIEQDVLWVKENISSKLDGLRVPDNFVMTAPAHVPSATGPKVYRPTRAGKPYLNPQTVALCDLLGLKNMINPGGLAPGTIDPALVPPSPPPPPPPKIPKTEPAKPNLPLPRSKDSMEDEEIPSESVDRQEMAVKEEPREEMAVKAEPRDTAPPDEASPDADEGPETGHAGEGGHEDVDEEASESQEVLQFFVDTKGSASQ